MRRYVLFAFLSLAPMLASAQPAPFEKEIAAFEAADAKSPPPQGAVLFIGSSSIRLWKSLEQDFPNLKTINRGFGGSQIEHSNRYFDKIVAPYRPRLIVFYAGGNDVAAGKGPQQVLADFKTFVDKVRTTLPDTPVLFISIRPSVARRHLHGREWLTNALVRDFAESDPTADFIDAGPALVDESGAPRADLLVPDMLHLNDEGYRAWTKVIRPRVEQALADDQRAQ